MERRDVATLLAGALVLAALVLAWQRTHDPARAIMPAALSQGGAAVTAAPVLTATQPVTVTPSWGITGGATAAPAAVADAAKSGKPLILSVTLSSIEPATHGALSLRAFLNRPDATAATAANDAGHIGTFTVLATAGKGSRTFTLTLPEAARAVAAAAKSPPTVTLVAVPVAAGTPIEPASITIGPIVLRPSP